jgi:hypothetical protein
VVVTPTSTTPTLVTPTKNDADYGQHSTSESISSSCATYHTHFWSTSRNSFARWQHPAKSWPTSAPTPGIFAPTPGTAARAEDHHPEATLNPPSAGTIAATELGRKSVLSPAPTTNTEKPKPSGRQQQHMSEPQPPTVSSSLTDSISKRKIIVDMGSHLSAYPHRIIPRRNDRGRFDLSAANGTTIHTYGWLPSTST